MAAANPITDRAMRYRAQHSIPAHEKRCVFCGAPNRAQNGARPFLMVGHVDGNESHGEPDNLSWTCRSCNSAASDVLRRAGVGRLTRQYNPTRGGGAANLGEWMQAVGAITPHIDRGDRGLSSQMSVSDAVAIIRATPHSRRSTFAAELRRRAGARSSERWNPAKRKNLFGLGAKPKAAKPRRLKSPLTLRQAMAAAREAGFKGRQSFPDFLEARRLEDRSSEQIRRLGDAYRVGMDAREAVERTNEEARMKPKAAGLYKGYRIGRTADGEYFSSADPDSRFESLAGVKKHIDWFHEARHNPGKGPKLSADQIERIVEMSYGQSAPTIAAYERLSVSTVRRIIREHRGRRYPWGEREKDRGNPAKQKSAAYEAGRTHLRSAAARYGTVNLTPSIAERDEWGHAWREFMAGWNAEKKANPGGFERCVESVSAGGSAADPRAVCAAAGRRKYGRAEMTRRSVAGKRRAARGNPSTVTEWKQDFYRQGLEAGRKDKTAAYPLYAGDRPREQSLFMAQRLVDYYGVPAAKKAAIAERFTAGYYDGFRGKRGHRNPAGAAAEAFEEFHGHPPEEVVTVEKRVHSHAHLAAAGELRKLVVRGVDHQVHTITGFRGALLCFNEERNQLFVEGGDQSLNLEDFGIRKPHEIETVGKVVSIDYFTRKDHLGDEGGTAVYSHEFRTTNERGQHVTVHIARYPTLIYRVRDEQLEFSGGSYEIRAEGIDK